MTEFLHSPSHFPSSPSSLSSVSSPNNGFLHTHQSQMQSQSLINNPNWFHIVEDDLGTQERDKEGDQLSLLTLLVTIFRKPLISCRTEKEELCSMEIGWPSNVRHVAHVTFDRFNGFLGLPVEFEPEVSGRAPSARIMRLLDLNPLGIEVEIGQRTANVFGVSTESMQLSYDSRGNSVPTILLLMQRRLYSQGGLQAEGIFRINAENSQEEYVRDRLNRGLVSDGVDVHCLAGLIKAWFRELPSGVLDSLTPEQVTQSQTEDECAQLVRLLPQTEAALLDWAINLMADVVQEEHLNKMNARNIAMVFAPNMTQMADPLTALMYAVQVMNFLKTLIVRTLREREDSVEPPPVSHLEPSDENGHRSPSPPYLETTAQENDEMEHFFLAEESLLESPPHLIQDNSMTDSGDHSFQTSVEKLIPDGNSSLVDDCTSEVPTQVDTLTEVPTQVDTLTEVPTLVDTLTNGLEEAGFVNGLKADVQANTHKSKTGQSSNLNLIKELRKVNEQSVDWVAQPIEKSRGISIVSRTNSRAERVEAWR
ncbi:hypothetical protein HHK36_017994 [Tetracentron sinense]|uniref:Uncharacterized protein n=1 Tax=Tetracentron sinense TaxID=13715 RepID=A0A835DD37_TETSI|nr:hypothetical protein HHK36_017994 [Tetracentron sinense]